MDPKISVLVPCCNVEKYLRQCMDSIINQTFQDIEIICLNDGSTDSTLDILKEYEAKDSRIVLIDKPNSGYGATMNIGLKKAKGEYVAIVESDDWIEPEMFEVMYSEAKSKNLDVVRCMYMIRNEITGIDSVMNESPYFYKLDTVFSPKDNKRIFFIAPSIWAMIYKRDFLERNSICFLETPGASYQDTSFNFKVLATADTMEVVSKVLHNYRINSNSSVNSPHKLYYVCDEDAEIRRYAKEHGVYDELREVLGCRMFGSYRWNYDRLGTMKLKRAFARRWSKDLKPMFRNREITRTHLSKGRIYRLWLMAYCPWVYFFKKKF